MIFSHDMFRSIDGRYVELLVTCTTGHVEATLLYFENNTISKTLAHVRTPLGLRYPYTKQDIYEATYVALEDVCRAIALESHELFAQEDLLKDHQQIHRVRLFLGGPWVRKDFHTKSKRWQQTHEISEQDIEDMLAQPIPQGHTRLDQHITAAYANEYAIDPAIIARQRVRDIELSYVDVFARVDLLETLFQVMHAELNISESQFEYHATIAALAAYTRSHYHPDRDRLEVFVHGAHADVLLHMKGHMRYAGTLEWGYDQIVKQLVDMSIAPSRVQAMSLLASYTSGHLDESLEETITELVAQYIQELVARIKESAEDPDLVIPQDWYIFAEKHIARFIVGACKARSEKSRVVLVKPKPTQQAEEGLPEGMSSLAAIQSEYIEHHVHNTIEK